MRDWRADVKEWVVGCEGENGKLAMRLGVGALVNHVERTGGAEIDKTAKDVWNLWSDKKGSDAELYLLMRKLRMDGASDQLSMRAFAAQW